ncbi:MAG: NADH-quinone oxidoreductase subunit C [Opitutaceae bacterium]
MAAALDLSAALSARFPGAGPRPSLDHPAFRVAPADVVAALGFLRDELGFSFLADLTAIDESAAASPRFTVVYHLYSPERHDYVRITADCADDAAPVMPSICALWPGANWHEREVYDMFGIRFEGHPDLRRILMWDGYPYFPLRKEFPLAGLDTPLPDSEVGEETQAGLIPSPMLGGPFVARPGSVNMGAAEPQAKDEAWSERREKPQ